MVHAEAPSPSPDHGSISLSGAAMSDWHPHLLHMLRTFPNNPNTPDHLRPNRLMGEAAERIEELEAALNGIHWRSVDNDNMEFSATITCFKMDNITAALKTAAK